jgi:Cu+-exporting ATPase
MRVDPAKSEHNYSYSAHFYHFCSAGCRSKFAKQPETFLAKTENKPQPAPADTPYTCPMHPQIRQTQPGSCPICGMGLEPVISGEDTGPSPELIDMRRRLWIGAALAVPVVILEMGAHVPGLNLFRRSYRFGSSSCSPRRPCCGRAGHSWLAAGHRCATDR